MYEQISHSVLNDILVRLEPEMKSKDLKHFYIRLGANFYAIYSLFQQLYGHRADFKDQLYCLVKTLALSYVERDASLKHLDFEREKEHDWFLHQRWVGYAVYCKEFAGNLTGLQQHLSYLQELGVNMLHIMPILACPPHENDGGYAVSDFRAIDAEVGTLKTLDALIANMKAREMLLVLDVVVNHTSDQHAWAIAAKQGDPYYQDFYHVFDDRRIPDIYEETMPEIFPETAPGNFTWDATMGKWVMTVFNNYQWDLNYKNPAVLIEMVDIILFWANKGADIVRLDAVAFLWKKLGSQCQNEREAHLILQLMKDCCQVVAPGVLFIAEAIVAPVEVTKYFGEDAINAKECEIAYNATFMALLWDAVATKNAKLLNHGIKSIPDKLERTTWLNYIRCHDDIGLGFDDQDIMRAGYDPKSHRAFILDYFTGRHPHSTARGIPFGQNQKNGDARIAGSLASLVGLEHALEIGDAAATQTSIQTILLLHGLIMSFGGIPLIYYGDAIGMLNDPSYLGNEAKKQDARWIHRPTMNWDDAEKRKVVGSVQHQIFSALKKMIAIRKEIEAFADHNNRELHEVDNPHLFVFSRFCPHDAKARILVVTNFSQQSQLLETAMLRKKGFLQHELVKEVISGEMILTSSNAIEIPAFRCFWLNT